MRFKLIILLVILAILSNTSRGNDENYAPMFSSITVDGKNFSLNDCIGNVTIMHIQNLEKPICMECEKELKEQIIELSKLSEMKKEKITIVTLNLRKNNASEDGKTLVEKWYKINVTWYWIEEFSPYKIANLYSSYYTIDGAISNPTIVLINQSLAIVGVYHVYCIGRGKIDGVQNADSLLKDAEKILAGETLNQKKDENKITFFGMFILGIITSFSPCSIVLLISMISYVFATKSNGNFKKEALIGLGVGIFFTFGLSLIFLIIGIMVSSIGFFISISSLFYLIAGIILLLLGINIFKPLGLGIRNGELKEKGINFFGKLSKKSLFLGAFFLGMIFAVGWAPCAISLVLPVFILVMAQKTTLLIGGLLLFAFGVGHGFPVIFLTTAVRSMRTKIVNAYIRVGKIIEKVFAITIIVIAILFILRYFGINFW
ncbi:MAG: cytochrome c biogenesis CcdA family protein [Candidatus Thermoplasmatota archaeon]